MQRTNYSKHLITENISFQIAYRQKVERQEMESFALGISFLLKFQCAGMRKMDTVSLYMTGTIIE